MRCAVKDSNTYNNNPSVTAKQLPEGELTIRQSVKKYKVKMPCTFLTSLFYVNAIRSFPEIRIGCKHIIHKVIGRKHFCRYKIFIPVNFYAGK